MFDKNKVILNHIRASKKLHKKANIFFSSISSNLIDREHVANYIVKNDKKYKLYNYKANKILSRPDQRFTLDYKEDLLVIKKIYQEFYNTKPFFNSYDIINFMDKNPEIKNLNKNCLQLTHNY